jgi:hypothetical protein
MITTKEIADLIEDKLGWTNGWKVDDSKYKKMCLDVASQIRKRIKKEMQEKKQ